MTDREALALLRLRAAGRMDAERAADLCRLAHGWPAGLVLGAAGAPLWSGPGRGTGAAA
jgi:ATP/maltotriose-dependent transcriptional regulator MalT